VGSSREPHDSANETTNVSNFTELCVFATSLSSILLSMALTMGNEGGGWIAFTKAESAEGPNCETARPHSPQQGAPQQP
jgi:hypothetical protein